MRDASRENFSSQNTIEEINAGSLQRIADAAEKMAANYLRMETDLAYYKREYARRGDEIQHLKNSRAGYMAALTRLRNKVAHRTAG